VPQPLPPHANGAGAECLIITVFTLTRAYMMQQGPPALTRSIKFERQVGGAGPMRPAWDIPRAWAGAWVQKMTRARIAGGFGLTLDAVLSLVPPAALGAGLPGAVPQQRTAAAQGGGDMLLDAAALAPWRSALRERAIYIAFFYGGEIGEHAVAAYYAFGNGELGRGITRLLHAACSICRVHNEAQILGWIGEALEVCRLRHALPQNERIYWVNAAGEMGLEYDILSIALRADCCNP